MNISTINNNLRMITVLPQRKNENSADVCKQDEVKTPLIKAHHALAFGYAPDRRLGHWLVPLLNLTAETDLSEDQQVTDVDENQQVINALSGLMEADKEEDCHASLEALSRCDVQKIYKTIMYYIISNFSSATKSKIFRAAGFVHKKFDNGQKKSLVRVIEPYLCRKDPEILSKAIGSLSNLCSKEDRHIIERFKIILAKPVDFKVLEAAIKGIGHLGDITDAEAFLPFLNDSLLSETARKCYRKLVPLEGFSLGEVRNTAGLKKDLCAIFNTDDQGGIEENINMASMNHDVNTLAEYLILPIICASNPNKINALKAVGYLADRLKPVNRTKMKLFIHHFFIEPAQIPMKSPEVCGEALITIAKLSEQNDEISIRFFNRFLSPEPTPESIAAAEAIGIVGNQAHAYLIKPYKSLLSEHGRHMGQIYKKLLKKPAP